MTQDEAKLIIDREPVGGAQFYNEHTDLFYNEFSGKMYFFTFEWAMSITWICGDLEELTPMSEIRAIALGDEND